MEAGHEACGFCRQSYHYEMEIRCVDCDRPVCPVCVVRVRESREWHCPECRAGEG